MSVYESQGLLQLSHI